VFLPPLGKLVKGGAGVVYPMEDLVFLPQLGKLVKGGAGASIHA